jgi:hypothetical protein
LAAGATASSRSRMSASAPAPSAFSIGPAGRPARTGASAASLRPPLHQRGAFADADEFAALVQHAMLEGDDPGIRARLDSLSAITSFRRAAYRR